MSTPARGFGSCNSAKSFQPSAVLPAVSGLWSHGHVNVNDNNVNEHNLIVISFIYVIQALLGGAPRLGGNRLW